MKKRYSFFTKVALSASLNSDHKHKLGAVIFKGNKLISIGFNQLKSHPLAKKYSSSEHKICLHAEMKAIFSLKDVSLLRGASILVVRSLKNGTIGCSKPCKACMAAIAEVGIKHIFYYDEQSTFQHLIV